MTLHYSLNENDFLQLQLFTVSKSKRIHDQRTKNWLIYGGTILLLSFMFYTSKNSMLAGYFLVFGIGWLIFFPLYQRSTLKNHYRRSVSEIYRYRFNQAIDITFKDDQIEMKDFTGEVKLNLSVVENIIEAPNYFYLKIKTGEYLIIPKSTNGADGDVKDELINLAGRLRIDFISNLDWKWK